MLKVKELSRRKLTEDFLEVTSFFQDSNGTTVYILGDNDAKYPDAEIDDEHTRNSPAFTTVPSGAKSKCEPVASSSLKKRKLVSRCTVNFGKYGETRNAPSVKDGSRCNRVFC